MKRGRLIAIYGINNLGKTVQAKRLVEKLKRIGKKAEYIKYGIYNLNPSGYILNAYLRAGNPDNLTPREFQIMHAFNRAQYEPVLLKKLKDGVNVVAEDYWGTGMAWGIGAGVEKEFLSRVNRACFREDLAILLDGRRFSSGIEDDHKHESDEQLTQRVASIHRELAKEFGWVIIKANQPIEEVAKNIWKEAEKSL